MRAPALLAGSVLFAALVFCELATAQEPSARPFFTPYTVKPQIRDRFKAAESLCSHYPKSLKPGNPGQVVIWVLVFIDTLGMVRRAVVHESSGDEGVDAAAVAAVLEFEFFPAFNRDRVVPVWVALPIDFRATICPPAWPAAKRSPDSR